MPHVPLSGVQLVDVRWSPLTLMKIGKLFDTCTMNWPELIDIDKL